MVLNTKRKIFIALGLALVVFSSLAFFYKKNTQKIELANELKESQIKAQKHKEAFLKSSNARLIIQKELLEKNKLLTQQDLKKFKSLELNPLITQADFNQYEADQNQIQSKISAFLIKLLQSRNKKWMSYANVEIKKLEPIEKAVNDNRYLYSAEVIRAARTQNKAAITFLSDIELAKLKK